MNGEVGVCNLIFQQELFCFFQQEMFAATFVAKCPKIFASERPNGQKCFVGTTYSVVNVRKSIRREFSLQT